MADLNISNMERPYDQYLFRSEGTTTNGNVETQPVKTEGGLNDIWIDTYMRSTNWAPKTRGFYIDGQTGYAEFTNVYVSGDISALSGTIGGFTINTTNLTSTVGGNTIILSSAAGNAITSGPTGSPTFQVTQAGVLYATGAVIDGTSTIGGRTGSIISGAINASGNFTDSNLNTSTRQILQDFTFDGWGGASYSGAFKTGDVVWNTSTGAITSGSGIIINKSGIVGVNSGTETFSINATTGDAYFSGTVEGGVVRTSSTGTRVEMNGASNELRIYDASVLRAVGYNKGWDFYNDSGVEVGSFYASQIDGTDNLLISNLDGSSTDGSIFLGAQTNGAISMHIGSTADSTLRFMVQDTSAQIGDINDYSYSFNIFGNLMPNMHLYMSGTPGGFITMSNMSSGSASTLDSGWGTSISGTPGNAPNGSMYYRTDDNVIRVKVAGAWTTLSTGGGGSFANTALSNLTTTSINQSLLPLFYSNYDIGSNSMPWRTVYANTISANNYGYVNCSSVYCTGSSNFGAVNTTGWVRSNSGGSDTYILGNTIFSSGGGGKVTIYANVIACPLPVTKNALSLLSNTKHKVLAKGVGHAGDDIEYLDIPDAPGPMKIKVKKPKIIKKRDNNNNGLEYEDIEEEDESEDIEMMRTVGFLYSCIKELHEEVKDLKKQLANTL